MSTEINLSYLLDKTGIRVPLIGFYDAPDPAPFSPLISPSDAGHQCMFCFYKRWLAGDTVLLTRERYGCAGASHHLFDQPQRSRDDFIRFLTDNEGLKCSKERMGRWLNTVKSYRPEYPNLLYGPLKSDQYRYLKTVTFFVNPDQLSMLMIAAQYFADLDDPEPVIAPFGSGCMQSVSLFPDLEKPQAMIAATDMAMRQYLPPDILAFTVTKRMVENLAGIDQDSFLEKGFIKTLKKARGLD